MSFPNIPNVTPSITITSNDVTNLLIASIAFEELGLAHLTNAEAEKVQAVVGTLPGISVTASSISQLLSINESVERTMRTSLMKEMLLQFKLLDILDAEGSSPTPPTPSPTPIPTRITLFSGSIVIPAGSSTPLSGTVFDQFGNPMSGVTVVLSADNGSVSPSSVVTDGSGNYTGVTYFAPAAVPPEGASDTIIAEVFGTSVMEFKVVLNTP